MNFPLDTADSSAEATTGDGGAAPARPCSNLDSRPALLWAVDRELCLTSLSGSAAALAFPSPSGGGRATIFDLFDTDSPGFPPIAATREALGGEPTAFELEWRDERLAGRIEPMWDARGRVTGCVGIAFVGAAGDLPAQRPLHDPLTELPSQALLVDRLERCLRRCERDPGRLFAVLFMDLDRFKLINDSLGHDRGDQLLAAFARRLVGCLRPSDTVARMSGDEFVVLLEEIRGLSDAVRVADRIHTALRDPFQVEGVEVFVSVSIGIASSLRAYRYAGELIRDADTAMYRSKARGRGCHTVFDRRMHAAAVKRLQLETDLRRALDREEFEVHYQPIVGLRSGKVESFEALLRWHHPLRGLLLPKEFLEVAEETGLTTQLSGFVLDLVCRQLQRWQELDPSLGVSINLSTKQFLQPDLVARLDALMEVHCLTCGSIAFEITEGVILHHADAVADTLDALKASDVPLALDDFGTGYSSLSYLQAFPIDSLKIDRSFISSDPRRGGQEEIVRAIVHLAHHLGLDIVAEGIESAEQRTWLQELGCQQGQGYYFSPPITGEEATKLLDRGPHW